MRTKKTNAAGNAAVIVILLILVIGAVCFFVFKESSEPELPAAGSVISSPAEDVMEESSSKADYAADEAGLGALDRAGSGASQSLPINEEGAIDWNARHSQLKAKYMEEFNEPQIGMNAKMRLASGRIVEGRITDITDAAVTVRISGTGKATYQRNQLSPPSQMALFRDVFAEYSAQKALAEEKASLGRTSAAPQTSE